MPRTLQQTPPDVSEHRERVIAYEDEAVRTARAAWREVNPGAISESWEPVIPVVATAVTGAQISASESAVIASGDMAVRTGQYRLPQAFIDPVAVAGEASGGEDLAAALYVPAIRAKQAVASGTAPALAMREVDRRLEGMVRGMVADAGRKTTSITMATRFTGGYTRMLTAPACRRCVILAGRWYRWNAGFLRHPRCDCVHIPTKSQQWATDEGFIADPYEYFESLSTAEQDRLLGPGNAAAVRDGADIFQVVNATTRRTASSTPLSYDGLTTTASTSRRRGIYRGTGERLTPEGIYAKASSKAEARRLLEQHGYILPGGQDPAGVLRGQREGYGQLGRGGKRVGARNAVEAARRTGVRHPQSRYTMTAAERRNTDARLSWEAVREGRNPYGREPLTDEHRRKAEFGYEKYVLGMHGGDPALPPR